MSENWISGMLLINFRYTTVQILNMISIFICRQSSDTDGNGRRRHIVYPAKCLRKVN